MKNPFLPLALSVIALVSANAADLPRLDSTQFEYKYEMTTLPDAEDVDHSGAFDFTGGSGWTSLTNGEAMVMNMTAGSKYLVSDKATGTAGDAWRTMNATSATGGSGYTIETLLKIDGQESGSGVNYVMNLQASTYDTKLYNASLNFKTNGIYWNNTPLTNLDAIAWHTYRIVREGSGDEKKFSVYVDGVLVKDGLGNGISADINRIILGAPGASYKGKATVAYLRFTKGAYAPPEAAKKWSGEFPVKYEMDAGDTRFVGKPAGGTDWSGTADSNSPITQNNGVLSVTLAQGKLAWWKANDSIWSDKVGEETAYTMEFKIKIRDKWNTPSVGDRVVQFICGNPRDAAVFYIGENSVTWEPDGAATYTTLNSADNTDAWHTFRLTYSGASQNGRPYVYTLSRDGEVIGTNLKGSTIYNQYASSGFPNLFRWGVTSQTVVGGSFNIDYIRWTTDGAWDYKGPPEALVVVIR
jgi:hypothetical protein